LINTVFFDLYQTLITYKPSREEWESEVLNELGIKMPAKAFRRAFNAADEYFYNENARLPLSKRAPDEINRVYAKHQSIVLKEGGVEPAPDLVRSILLRWQNTKFNHVLFDDVLPALNELRRRDIALGLVSNVDKDITPMLDDLGLSPFLTTVVTSRETGFTKPHPEIFQEALRRSNSAADNSIFVGDQFQIDIQGASAVGMKAVLIDRGGFSEAPRDCLQISSLPQVTAYL
jgi:putative hydrolase of the HAD superfamily